MIKKQKKIIEKKYNMQHECFSLRLSKIVEA